jgi:hypothetical protein
LQNVPLALEAQSTTMIMTKNYEYVALQCHLDCPCTFVKILDVDKSACTTDNPGLSLVLVIGKEEKT